ncbi:MAG: hypothetical protein ACKV19_19140 [Verrucomicrobiales bacterium]
MRLLQVRNPHSYLSNEFIFFVETGEEAIARYKMEPSYLLTSILNSALINDHPEEAHILIAAGADLNLPHLETHFELERPPLVIAAHCGRTGRIVLGGAGLVRGLSRDFAVVRCLENGALDASFGSEGVTTTDISGSYNEQVYAMARHTDDTIVLGGYHRDDFAMVRYLPNGALDTGFGTGGKVFTPGNVGTPQQINALAIMSDGCIVVAGQTRSVNNVDVAVARYLSNGTPDGSFGTGNV